MVLFPDELKVSRSLARRLQKDDYEIRVDSAFREVIQACGEHPRVKASPAPGLYRQIVDAFCALHELGYAHSVETWIDGELAGGLYGVAIGGMFCGESMFHRSPMPPKSLSSIWCDGCVNRATA